MKNKKIEYLYTTNGSKVSKKVTNGTNITETDYLTGYQYVKPNAGVWDLQFFPTAEGYVDAVKVGANTVFTYVYNYTDHLGNVRLSYAYDINNASLKIMEENNYYPFGLKHNRYNFGKYAVTEPVLCPTCPPVFVLSQDTNYKYKYNGKELQDELGLNVTAMDFRQYDNALGRFSGIDKLAEMHYEHNPYNFAGSNPIFLSDPTGLDWYYQQGKDGSEVYQWFDGSDERKDWIRKGESYIHTWSGNDGKKGNFSLNKDGSFSILTYDDSDLGYSIETFNFSDHKKQFSNADINTKAGDWSFAKAMKALDDLFNSAASYGTGTNAGASNMGSDVKNWYQSSDMGELFQSDENSISYGFVDLYWDRFKKSEQKNDPMVAVTGKVRDLKRGAYLMNNGKVRWQFFPKDTTIYILQSQKSIADSIIHSLSNYTDPQNIINRNYDEYGNEK